MLSAYRRVAAAYTARHPDITVAVEIQGTEDSALTRLDTQFDSGDPPDLFETYRDELPALVARQRVQPVDELLEARGVLFGDNFQRLGLEAMSAQSALQCMPVDVSPLVVYYNTTLVHPSQLALSGQPAPNPIDGWTWAQFSRAAHQSVVGLAHGVYLPARLDLLTTMVRSAGGDTMDDPRQPTTLTLTNPQTRATIRQILRLARSPHLGFSQRQDPVSAFEHGDLGMIVGRRDLVPRLRAGHVPFDVLPLPSLGTPVTIADTSGLCLARTGHHIDASADFLAFATGPDGARILAHSGEVVPANLPTLNSAAFGQPGREPAHGEVFVEAVRRAQSMPFSAQWPDLDAQVQPLLEGLFSDPRVDPSMLLAQLDALSATLLAPPTPSA